MGKPHLCATACLNWGWRDVQRLSTFAAFVEDLSWIPIAHRTSHNDNSSSRESDALLWPQQALCALVHITTCRHTFL